VTRSNRLLVLMAAAVLLAAFGYLAVPWIWMGYVVFFGPGLACGNICDRPEFTEPLIGIVIVAVAAYVLVLGLGIWWVIKGEPD
jgi:hypothetical protein